jgi:hypothetical protein
MTVSAKFKPSILAALAGLMLKPLTPSIRVLNNPPLSFPHSAVKPVMAAYLQRNPKRSPKSIKDLSY